MKSMVQYSVIDAHSAGAPARVVIGGVPPAQGASIKDKRSYLMEHYDSIRKLLMYEPRGSSEMCGSILMSPCDPTADIGIVFIESGGWPLMCGAGTIGAATVMVDSGLVKVEEPITKIRFDTPAGIVTAHVEIEAASAKSVTIENVPSYMVAADQKITLQGHGDVTVDIVYGGNYYALVPAAQFGLSIAPGEAGELVKIGREVRSIVNQTLAILDPISGEPVAVPMVIFTKEAGPGGTYRNMVYFGGSGVDRSPGGTGTSARMAQRFFRKQQAIGEKFLHESIIGSLFEGTIARSVKVAGTETIIPRICGRAHILAHSTFVLDPQDPYPEGFGVGYAGDATRPEQYRQE